jgi:cell division inhibitor SepF
MSQLWQKALLYLGLVDEEAIENEDSRPVESAPIQSQVRTVSNRSEGVSEGVVGRRVEPPAGRGPMSASDRTFAPAGSATGAVRQVKSAEAQCDIVEAAGFSDAKLLADRIRARVPVVLNLRATDPDMVRRLVDFASGLTYALDGTMRKISEGVIMVLPPRISLGREEKRRLADLGLYSTADDGE